MDADRVTAADSQALSPLPGATAASEREDY